MVELCADRRSPGRRRYRNEEKTEGIRPDEETVLKTVAVNHRSGFESPVFRFARHAISLATLTGVTAMGAGCFCKAAVEDSISSMSTDRRHIALASRCFDVALIRRSFIHLSSGNATDSKPVQRGS